MSFRDRCQTTPSRPRASTAAASRRCLCPVPLHSTIVRISREQLLFGRTITRSPGNNIAFRNQSILWQQHFNHIRILRQHHLPRRVHGEKRVHELTASGGAAALREPAPLHLTVLPIFLGRILSRAARKFLSIFFRQNTFRAKREKKFYLKNLGKHF